MYMWIYTIGGINGQFNLGQLELSPSLISSLRGHNTRILKGTGKTRGALPPKSRPVSYKRQKGILLPYLWPVSNC